MAESRGYYALAREMIDRVRAGSLTERQLVDAMGGDRELMQSLLLDLTARGIIAFDEHARHLTVHEGQAARFSARWEE